MRKKAKSRSPARLMASREGLLLDPVYGGKAFAGLLVDISAGRYAAGDNVLFIMTVGSPRPLRLCEGFPRCGPQGFPPEQRPQPLATQRLETPQRVWEMPNIIVPEAIGEQS